MIKDIKGQRFGKLVANKYVYSDKSGYAYWECTCDCGKKTVVMGANLRSGKTKSCGCLYKHSKTHGGSGTRLYKTWCSMKERCARVGDKSYPRYGGRGIRVCEEWKNDFDAFRSWAYHAGYNDFLSIDRINVNGNYEPSNCRWATQKTQANNKRNSRKINYNERLLTIAQWANITGVPEATIRARLFKLRWDVETALTTPAGGVKSA